MKSTSENSYGGKNLNSSTLAADSFLGFVNPIRANSLVNLAAAFYVPVNVNLDLEYKLGKAPEFRLESLYMAQKSTEQTYSGVLGMGWELTKNLAIGFSAQAYYLAYTRQVFVQAIMRSEAQESSSTSTKAFLAQLFESTKFDASAIASGARLGILWQASETISFGATVSKSSYVHTRDSGGKTSWSVATYEDGSVVSPNTLKNIAGVLGKREFSATIENTKPFRRFPLLLRTGLSWTPTDSTKINSDIYVSNRNTWREIEPERSYRTTANFAIGAEQKMSGNYFVAGGVFSDFDENPQVSANPKNDEPDHIDHYGGALSFGISTPEAESALTIVHVYGRGKSIPLSVSSGRLVRDLAEQYTTAQFSLTKKL